jgi:uncharacterized protein (TIGR02145 family)
MSLITRGEKGEKLTIEEMDGNLLYLEELAQTANSGATEVAYDLTVAVPYKAYRAKLTAVGIEWPGYGFLYNWFAVDDARGIVRTDGGSGLEAPNLWRVPSDSDWNELITFAGDGGKLKSAVNSNGRSFYGWVNNGKGNDLYNFAGLPVGYRSASGQFSNLGITTQWWSSTSTGSAAIAKRLNAYNNSVDEFLVSKTIGYSVRLVREATAGELLLNDGDNASEYKGNDDTQYSTVKIGSQIWLAQNLRETEYVNGDPIFNASGLPGGSSSDGVWIAKGDLGEGAWTVYLSGSVVTPYLPKTIELLYTDVLENTLGQSVIWETIYDGYNTVYRAQLDSERAWYPTHIKVTPGYDIGKYDENQEIIQRTLIIKRAVTDENYIIFFPIKVSSNGVTTIESFSNYTGSSNDSGVNIEILEYQPIGSGSSGVGGLGISLLD